MSDDGSTALTLIAMLGSVFSPLYAARRARAPQDPLDHCAMNVAVYPLGGPRTRARADARWALTERGVGSVRRSSDQLLIGPSSMTRLGESVVVHLDEVSSPAARRIKGSVVLRPTAWHQIPYDLDPRGRHRWTPIAPLARVSVVLEDPALSFEGSGYLDANHGDEPLERAFRSWSWSRSTTTDAVDVAYDARLQGGTERHLGLRFEGRDVTAVSHEPSRLARTRWNLPRTARVSSREVRVQHTLEDTPFYARSLLRTDGGHLTMHEELSLDRFSAPWVQMLLPFRMRREP